MEEKWREAGGNVIVTRFTLLNFIIIVNMLLKLREIKFAAH